jgi:hypothetical protein
MLHCGSMLARKVKLLNPTEHANGGRPIRTIRFNLACCRSYNADKPRHSRKQRTA